MEEVEVLILGAGLAGLSSYHIGHGRCILLESKSHAFGHISSYEREGFTWDEGPHVSFTKHAYVRELFEDSLVGKFEEYEVTTGNYFKDRWIDHPAQSNLYQVPEPLRSQCLDSFLSSRERASKAGIQEIIETGYISHLAKSLPRLFRVPILENIGRLTLRN